MRAETAEGLRIATQPARRPRAPAAPRRTYAGLRDFARAEEGASDARAVGGCFQACRAERPPAAAADEYGMGWVCTPFGDFETTPLAHDAERHGVAGVFLFIRTEDDVDFVVYVGQTESLSDCASGAAWDQARSLGARSVHVVCIAEADARERFRAWLVAQLRPPLNHEADSWFH